jgi:hypothetical protein
MNYDYKEEEKVNLNFQKTHENDGTSLVDVTGSAVFPRQQLYEWGHAAGGAVG